MRAATAFVAIPPRIAFSKAGTAPQYCSTRTNSRSILTELDATRFNAAPKRGESRTTAAGFGTLRRFFGCEAADVIANRVGGSDRRIDPVRGSSIKENQRQPQQTRHELEVCACASFLQCVPSYASSSICDEPGACPCPSNAARQRSKKIDCEAQGPRRRRSRQPCASQSGNAQQHSERERHQATTASASQQQQQRKSKKKGKRREKERKVQLPPIPLEMAIAHAPLLRSVSGPPKYIGKND